MGYCVRCGKRKHDVSNCRENYNRDGERISKVRKWTEEEEDSLANGLIVFIEKKAEEHDRSQQAIYQRLYKIMEDMND